ncbi:MAG: hypothetical protein N3G20_05500, partial [Verrucomicrobiae bacterium]|nr:hypothetical protein [Verrucomicrobiae bacterium]
SLDSAEQRTKLDELISRVKQHPAMYAYFVTDEPGATAFAALGKLVSHLRERDPAHLAYINLFPTYASNEQLGTKGDVVTAYREHLRRFVCEVKPALLSYDHYQFRANDDGNQYFLNLSMIRQAARWARIPFLNIVQACSWTPSMRVPNCDEMRYLVYTTLAYGAQGISYYVYCCPGHTGGIALPDGTPTGLYHALKVLNRNFVAVASELQGYDSMGVYHTTLNEPGCEPMPPGCVFRICNPRESSADGRGILLGLFGRGNKPTHVIVVNLNYRSAKTTAIQGPGELEKFDAESKQWKALRSTTAEFSLEPGGGVLLRSER